MDNVDRTWVIVDAHIPRVPKDVMEDMSKLWQDRELGNDYYYVQWDHKEDRNNYPALAKYIEENVGFANPRILIHYCW